jgi:seryl-tRNA synthetase
MLQINVIRQQAEQVKQRLSVRHFADLDLVDKIVELDERVRSTKIAAETLQARINANSKEIVD